MKVLITELIWQEGLEELVGQGFQVDYDDGLWEKRNELLRRIHRYDALIVRNQTEVDRELLEAGTQLKAIGRLGVGLDNIDVHAAQEKGVKVVYARHANATSVAEYVMAAMLTACRPLDSANRDVRKGEWDRQKHTGKELSQKTLALIGLGEISHRVAKRARAFGMNVAGYDPFITENDHIIAETGVRMLNTLQEALAVADFMSVHVPLTPATRRLISEAELARMKPSAYLINTSRGGTIDETALADALTSGRIAGAFLDVLETEPITPSHRLLACPNVVVTPHIAGLTHESQLRTSLLVAKETATVLHGGSSMCVLLS